MRLAWLLRGPAWRKWHLHKCLECGRTFAGTEPGCWTDLRADQWPELCRCRELWDCGPNEHVNCRSAGPYCPGCAQKVEAFWREQREAYREW
jgi:hypothetical protein